MTGRSGFQPRFFPCRSGVQPRLFPCGSGFPPRLFLFTATLVLSTAIHAAHDDDVGARYVDGAGVNAADCLDHHAPCLSIQYALAKAQPGNTVKVAAGIYDMSGVDPESFLFGTIKAAGGYREEQHYAASDPEGNPTILVGVDVRYRHAMAKQGFQWSADMASAQAGIVDTSVAEALQATQAAPAACEQGFAGQFPCRNVDFQAQIALNQFSTAPASAANLWGFVDLNDQREYAVMGLRNGTAVVEVTDPANPREVDTVAGNFSGWREVKIYQHFDAGAGRYRAYAYVSTEADNSGLQVIDLSGLPNSVSLATTLTDTGSQHTLYVSNINYATNVALPGQEAFLYSAGSDVNGGAWRAYSLANPAAPALVAESPTPLYMHDSTSLHITDQRTTQCDQGHNPCEVLVDFNETTVDLWDVTDKAQPVLLSSTTYPNVRYTHSGWPSSDQRSLFIHDELEEIQLGLNTRIYTMALDDLRAPSVVESYFGPNTTTDHNGYTKGDLYYVSHYRRGLVVFDASDPEELREVGSFDTFLAPVADSAGTDGAWGVYPYLPSGTVVVSDMSNGLFVLADNTTSLDQSAGRLGFSGTPASAAEDSGSVTVRVQRRGGFAGPVSVDYATSDGTATAGVDYAAATGTLHWAGGDATDRTFTITLFDDADVEPNETIRVTLSDPAGGAAIDGSGEADVTIANDDFAPPAPPPSGGGASGGGGALDFGLLLALALLAWCAAESRRRRAIGKGAGYLHGLITSSPQLSKSGALRVASVAPVDRAIAAIWASKWEIGRPRRRRSAAISA